MARFAISILMILPLALGCRASVELPGDTQPTGRNQVKLHVVKGPKGTVLALVPVFIKGQGPFAFALDTGASQSMVDKQLVQQLGLQVVGTAGEVTGITGTETAEAIKITDWRLGSIKLQEAQGITVDIPEPSGKRGLRGLLGSDVLSRYSKVTIDYQNEVLTLEG